MTVLAPRAATGQPKPLAILFRWPRWPAFAAHEAAPGQADPGAALLQLLLLAALWIAAHPYRGVDHDARLYAVQALHALGAGPLDRDLYLQYGSQDAFSLFTLAYRPLIGAFGVSTAALIATAAGQLLWFAAIVTLTRTLFSAGREGVVAAVGAIVLSGGYGAFAIFRYAETLATPRLFAEALALFALAFALRGRLMLAGLGIAMAAGAHPIMALGAASVLAVYAARRDRRLWILIGLGVLAGVALALAQVSPFDRLLRRFDASWFAVVQPRSAYCFLVRWRLNDWAQVASIAAMLGTAWRVGAPCERRLLVAVAVATAAMLTISFVGGDLLRDIFVVNIQPWRVLWLTTLLANAFAAVVALRLPAEGMSRRLWLAALAVSAAAGFYWQKLPLAPALFLVASGTVFWEARRGAITAPPARYALWAVAITAATLAVYLLALQLRPSIEILKWALGAAIAAASIAAILLPPPSAKPDIRTGLIAAGLLVGALLLFDARTPWRRFLESGPAPADLTAFVGGERNLYWEDGVELLWLKLRRDSYYSCLQGSGAMFYAGTAQEFQRRADRLSGLRTRDFIPLLDAVCPAIPGSGQGAPPRTSLAQACRALPELDAVVLNHPVAGVPVRLWRAPVMRYDERATDPGTPFNTYYKVRCADVR